LLGVPIRGNQSFQLSWPTPNKAFISGLGYHAFLEKTGPGKDFSSGAFGCVRNNGNKFHEGIDLSPVKSTKEGKPIDNVYAAMPGVVSHINYKASTSAYGRYVVLEHNSFHPVLYSLYGHLDSIHPSVKLGDTIQVAGKLGQMGNTASFKIPLNRSHLHFEIGIRLSNKFQNWYDRQPFTTQNHHGNFNGYNLVGFDPLHFYSSYQSLKFKSPQQYLNTLPVVLKILVPTNITPDIVLRNPSLASNYSPSIKYSSWECWFGPYGIPLRFIPREKRLTVSTPKILSFDTSTERNLCRSLVLESKNRLQPSNLLNTFLEILFVR